MRRVRTPAYAFLFVTLTFQFADFMFGIAPYRVSSVVWRFATAGSLANSVGNVLLLILLIYAVALVSSDRTTLAVAGTVSALVAMLLFFGTGSFTLDALQLRGRVDPAAIRKFDGATGQALVKLIVEAVVSTIFAVSAFRARASVIREMMREERTFDSPIVGAGRPPALRAP